MERSIRPRKQLRLSDYDYSSPGYYFVTICTRARQCVFGEVVDGITRLNDVGMMVEKCWREIPGSYQTVHLDRCVVMPNHLHGIVILSVAHEGAMNRAPTSGSSVGAQFIAPSLGEVVRAFKARCTTAVHKSLSTQSPLWQRNYYEHVIRSETSLQAIREYIVNNPIQWHLDEENPERVR